MPVSLRHATVPESGCGACSHDRVHLYVAGMIIAGKLLPPLPQLWAKEGSSPGCQTAVADESKEGQRPTGLAEWASQHKWVRERVRGQGV